MYQSSEACALTQKGLNTLTLKIIEASNVSKFTANPLATAVSQATPIRVNPNALWQRHRHRVARVTSCLEVNQYETSNAADIFERGAV